MPALRDALAAPALALAFLLPFQVQIPSPSPISGSQRDLPLVRIEDMYGPLQVEDLDRIAHDGGSYHRRLVLTRGVLSDLVPGRFLVLEQGTARVLLLPFESVDYHDYISLRGVDVDLTGVVRVLPAKQKSVLCRGTYVLESKCEDWDLPVLPDAQIQWPPVSITIVKMSDRGTSGGPRRSGPRSLADTGVAAAAAEGKPVRAIGQFRGANLCRDLPAESRRDLADWVLLTSEGPLWVTGRRPAGKGFQLDPAYRPDTARWLEVSGKVLVAGEVSYLKAGKVALIARPEEAEAVPCPP